MTFDQFYRKLPSFKGKLRLANMLFGRAATNKYVETKSGNFFLPNLKDNQYFEIYTKGNYEPDLVKFIVKALPPNGCLLDIGANIGSVAIPVALARPDVKIISVEALPRNFEFLLKNIQANKLTNIHALNVCCSNVDGKVMKFYHHEYKVGSSSFHSLHSKDYVELITKTLDRQLEELGIDKADVMKIDTEGSEALIFQGASNLFKKSKPVVLFEFNEFYEKAVEGLQSGDAQQLLLNEGYQIFNFDSYPNEKPFPEALVKGSGEFLAIHGLKN